MKKISSVCSVTLGSDHAGGLEAQGTMHPMRFMEYRVYQLMCILCSRLFLDGMRFTILQNTLKGIWSSAEANSPHLSNIDIRYPIHHCCYMPPQLIDCQYFLTSEQASKYHFWYKNIITYLVSFLLYILYVCNLQPTKYKKKLIAYSPDPIYACITQIILLCWKQSGKDNVCHCLISSYIIFVTNRYCSQRE